MKKLIYKLRKICEELNYVRNELKYCKINNLKPIFLMSTPSYGNIGDQAITVAEQQLINEVNKKLYAIEMTSYSMLLHKKTMLLLKLFIKNKPILINGGGFLGTLWIDEENTIRNIISCFKENKIIIFPQTLFFEKSDYGNEQKAISKQIYDAHNNLTIYLRDEQSYNIAKELFDNVDIHLVPDVVTYLNYSDSKSVKREGVCLCLRKDHEKTFCKEDLKYLENKLLKKFDTLNYTDTVVDYTIDKSKRLYEVEKKLNEFKKYELIVTDRLHGMIFATITGTPCIAFDNASKKVSGVYEWIKNNDYVIIPNNLSDIENNIECLINKKNNSYNNSHIQQMFDGIKNNIRNNI